MANFLHEKLPPSYIQDAKNFSVVKPLNSGEARASPASPVPRPLLCSISKFFHNSKICNSCKNGLLFVCILWRNSYFYLLCQFSAVCLLENDNLFTFSEYFYHFYSKKCRQIAAKCNKIVKLNDSLAKKTLETGFKKKKNSSPRVRSEPAAPIRHHISNVVYYKMSFLMCFWNAFHSHQYKTVLDCFRPM